MTVESDRRKLRQVYQQTKSRKRAVADARDGKKGGNSRQNNNNNNNNNSRRNNNNDRNNNDRNNNNRRNDRNEGSAPRRFIVSERVTRQHGFGKGGRQVVQSRARREEGSRRRFADKNVAKSGARARFSRAADSRQNNNNNNGKKGKKADNNQPRFKRAAQTKQAKVQIRKNQQQQQKQKKDGKKKQDKPKQDKPKEAKQAPLSLDQLDAQLAAYKN